MGADSKIEWTDHTFNPWIGCTKVSDGCKHCYAESYDKRVRGIDGKQPRRWGPTAARERTSPANWRKPLQWDAEAKRVGERHRVFCASLADVLDNHESIGNSWRPDLWALIEATPHLDWLLLTKRPEHGAFIPREVAARCWVGTTVENQEQAEKRIPWLLRIPAKVRFLSCEPLLERVDMSHLLAGIDWVIVGGESGHGARPFNLQWARSLREQCWNAEVAFFCKQLGSDPRQPPAIPVADELPMLRLRDRKGGDWSEWPADLRVREFPKEIAP